MNSGVRYWIITLLVALAATIGGVYLLQVMPLIVEYSASVGIALFFVLMSLFYALYIRRKVRQTTCEIYDLRQRICRLGIKEIHRRAEDTIVSCLNDVQEGETYKWLGFSSVNVVYRQGGERALIEKAKGARSYEFCTLDPEAQQVLEAQASWQEGDLELVTNNVRMAASAIDTFKRMGLNVSNPTHFFPPTFRLVILGEREIHVGFYGPGQTGIDTAEIELVHTGADECLFKWFQWFYTKTIEDANRARAEKMVLKAKIEDPSAGLDTISQTLRDQGIEAAREEVQRVLEEYDIV